MLKTFKALYRALEISQGLSFLSKILCICYLFLLLVPLVQFSTGGQKSTDNARKIDFKPFELTAFDRNQALGERGWLEVPENRSNPSSKTIKLAVVRLKSKAKESSVPVVYLAGGPGGSSIESARLPFLLRLLKKLQQTHDIILMDQRGAGWSRPRVSWISPNPLPGDAFLTLERAVEYQRKWSHLAIESFKKRGIDLRGYNTVESAHDLYDLCMALKVKKINLIGYSYGTHLALATVRYHSNKLDSVVLVGTEGPNHTFKLPSTFDSQLKKLSDLAVQDPKVGSKVPDMVTLLRRILSKFEEEPIILSILDRLNNQRREVRLGKFGLQVMIRLDAGDGKGFPKFPALFYALDKGDYSLLKEVVEKRYNQFRHGISGMTRMMDLYSGATEERMIRIKKEAKNAILGNVMNFPIMYIGDIWGHPDLGDTFRSPLRTSIRTLFVSGTLDSNTPPYQAEELRWGFANSFHIIVEYAGHKDMIPHPKIQEAIVDFLNGKDVSKVKVSLGKPSFKPIPKLN